jgi:hypothetical protein
LVSAPAFFCDAIGFVPDAQAPRYYLFERKAVLKLGQYQWEWHRYEDYTDPMELPLWLVDPAPGYVTPLSQGAAEYDYAQQLGNRNMGAWIDAAAIKAGR